MVRQAGLHRPAGAAKQVHNLLGVWVQQRVEQRAVDLAVALRVHHYQTGGVVGALVVV
jgi:hypothetical protein